MNLPELHNKLIAAARSNRPAETVPYAFEKRITALVQQRAPIDAWELLAQALWRAAAPCIALTLLILAWSVVTPDAQATVPDLAQQLEQTVLAGANPDSTDLSW